MACIYTGERNRVPEENKKTQPTGQEDKKMTNTATMTYTASQIIENIQNKVEVIRKREAARKSALRRMISFLFNCEAGNQYNLPQDMQARLYL